MDSDIQSKNEAPLQEDPVELASECPICLRLFTDGQEVGIPDSCNKHVFCVGCLEKWTQTMNTCPVDRQNFSLILVKKHLSEEILKQIPVVAQQRNGEIDVEVDVLENITHCNSCFHLIRDNVTKCVGCEGTYHSFCSNPPCVGPPEEYFCFYCIESNRVQMVAIMAQKKKENEKKRFYVPRSASSSSTTEVPQYVPRTASTRNYHPSLHFEENNLHEVPFRNQEFEQGDRYPDLNRPTPLFYQSSSNYAFRHLQNIPDSEFVPEPLFYERTSRQRTDMSTPNPFSYELTQNNPPTVTRINWRKWKPEERKFEGGQYYDNSDMLFQSKPNFRHHRGVKYCHNTKYLPDGEHEQQMHGLPTGHTQNSRLSTKRRTRRFAAYPPQPPASNHSHSNHHKACCCGRSMFPGYEHQTRLRRRSDRNADYSSDSSN